MNDTKLKIGDIVKVKESRIIVEKKFKFSDINSFEVIHKYTFDYYYKFFLTKDTIMASTWDYNDVYYLKNIYNNFNIHYHIKFLEIDVKNNRNIKIKNILQ